MLYVWIAAIILFIIIEAATAQLTTIWFAAGAVAALICELFGVSEWIQVLVFVLASVVCLLLTRPIVKRYVRGAMTPTNADRYIGAEGIVTEDINNIAASGLVQVKGSLWTARSMSGEIIPKDSLVKVRKIEGVKLFVELATKKNDVQE